MEDKWDIKLYTLKNVEEMLAMIFYRGQYCIFKVSEKCAESARMDRKWIRKISGIFGGDISRQVYFFKWNHDSNCISLSFYKKFNNKKTIILEIIKIT